MSIGSVRSLTVAAQFTLLELHGVSKAFSGVPALDAVDFDVRAGEVHALVGENGAGKSTLMNIIGGLLRPDAGHILWLGRPVHLRSPRDAQDLGIAFVHQELALVPQLSAAENIFLGRHPARGGWVRWADVHRRAEGILAALGASFDSRRLVEELSLADRQLTEIARALAFDSRLVIMDEPTAPLAKPDAEALFGSIGRLRERGIAVIFISHRLNEVFQISDRVTVLRDGRSVLTAETHAIDHDRLVRAMIGGAWELAEMQTAKSGEEALRLEGAVNLAVRRSEIVGLAGLAGAGRTELLQAAFGWGEQRGLRIFVDGRLARVRSPRDAIREGIALAPDDRKSKGLIPGASLRANVALASGRRRIFVRGRQEYDAVARLAGELRIKAASPDQPVVYLSGGNQQKAVLARWLMTGARIFLLDEPTRGIDVASKAEIHDLLRGLAGRGAAVLFASSETEELLHLADRIVVMHRGRITGEMARPEATEERILRLAMGGLA